MVWMGDHRGRLAPSLVALIAEVDDRYPNRSRRSDGSIGDAAHQGRVSDHNIVDGFVCAVDITEDPVNGPDLHALWDHLIATRDRRVKYLIYERRIVKSYVDSAGRPAWVPQRYTGANPHDHHMHISVTTAGRFDVDPWLPPEPEPFVEEDDMPKPQLVMDPQVPFLPWLVGADGVSRIPVLKTAAFEAFVAAYGPPVTIHPDLFEAYVDVSRRDVDLDSEDLAKVKEAVKAALREGAG